MYSQEPIKELWDSRVMQERVDDVFSSEIRIKNCLNGEGITILREIMALGSDGILRIPNLGIKSCTKIARELEIRGLRLRSSELPRRQEYVICAALRIYKKRLLAERRAREAMADYKEACRGIHASYKKDFEIRRKKIKRYAIRLQNYKIN